MSTPWQRHLAAHPRGVDITMVLVLFAVAVGGSALTGSAFGRHLPVWLAVLLSAVSATALLGRRTHPRTVVVVTALSAVCEGAVGYLLTPLSQAPLIVALFSLGLRTDRRTTRIYAVVTLALLIVTALFADPLSHNLLLTTLNPVAWVFLPAVLGSAVQLRRAYLAALRARAEHAEQTREEEARHRVAQERMRIARELHDVVAHHLALANAQAGTAVHLLATRPEQVRGMLESLAETTSSALVEMKATVGLLRQDNEADAPLGPAPGLGQLDDLVAAFTAAGLSVRTTVEGGPRPLPGGVDLNAYRIAQEALTNVTKHSVTRSADVRLVYRSDRLTLTVTNDGTGAPATPAPGRGFGLIGMRERAQSAGGTLYAGPRPGGGFEVICTLPLRRRQEEGEAGGS
ncbi:sensor histidine kinase [Streptomyces paludis]|uniref:histidine kinase n=1 Tax=Streptomyces paludis TaxID=2282738 RepID=A0A345HI72_9ACTN|nr:sensor histidine kinase [Streptomyces paludis]AXG76396.1 sensor histidine kinase [Streptomyces paludis]